MAYWLMKSEPDVFSIDDLRRKNVAGWDGVRNYQARNHLRAMRLGDWALFYHSRADPPAIVGLMTIVREAYPDPTAEKPALHTSGGPGRRKSGDPGWDQVDVQFVKRFPAPLSLEEIKRRPELQTLVLLRHSRLSVQPITASEWERLMKILDK
jgi:predicted RNA-binding protein with PUA-like domain